MWTPLDFVCGGIRGQLDPLVKKDTHASLHTPVCMQYAHTHTHTYTYTYKDLPFHIEAHISAMAYLGGEESRINPLKWISLVSYLTHTRTSHLPLTAIKNLTSTYEIPGNKAAKC